MFVSTLLVITQTYSSFFSSEAEEDSRIITDTFWKPHGLSQPDMLFDRLVINLINKCLNCMLV